MKPKCAYAISTSNSPDFLVFTVRKTAIGAVNAYLQAHVGMNWADLQRETGARIVQVTVTRTPRRPISYDEALKLVRETEAINASRAYRLERPRA